MTSDRETTRIGLGTHRLGVHGQRIVRHAVLRGCCIVDTAPNYLHGHAQEIVGEALHDIQIQTAPGINLSTKVGFMPTPLAPGSKGIPADQCVGNHCLAQSYIRIQAARNRLELDGRPTDVLFLHNPEVQRERVGIGGLPRLLTEGFEACEALRMDGAIQAYGIATWSGLFEHLPVRHVCQIARDVGGSRHGLRAIQLPISLVKCASVSDALLYDSGPLIDAQEAGLMVYASAPIHGGELLTALTGGFIRRFADGMDTAQFCVQFVRSIGLVDVVLFSTSSTEHFDSIYTLSGIPTFDQKSVLDILSLIV